MKQLILKQKEIGTGKPLICVPVMEMTKENIIREITYLSESLADMIEWRVDAFEEFLDYNAVREVLEAVAPVLGEKIFLYTFRTKKQGGEAQIEKEKLNDLHDIAVESGCVDLIDIEYFEEEKPQHKIREIQKKGCKVIASHHDFEQTPTLEVMKMLLEKMCVGGADIVKIAVMPQSKKDVLNLLEVTEIFKRENPDTPVITMSMGSMGSISRLCGENFGSCVTFGSNKICSAPGQYQMQDLAMILETIHKSNENEI